MILRRFDTVSKYTVGVLYIDISPPPPAQRFNSSIDAADDGDEEADDDDDLYQRIHISQSEVVIGRD